MRRDVDVTHVAGAVKAGDCVVKAPLYDLAALFTDAEIQARIADKERARRIDNFRMNREMLTEFRRMDREGR